MNAQTTGSMQNKKTKYNSQTSVLHVVAY